MRRRLHFSVVGLDLQQGTQVSSWHWAENIHNQPQVDPSTVQPTRYINTQVYGTPPPAHLQQIDRSLSGNLVRLFGNGNDTL